MIPFKIFVAVKNYHQARGKSVPRQAEVAKGFRVD